MANKVEFSAKIVLVQSSILDLERLSGRKLGCEEAAIVAVALRNNLSFEEKAELAKFEFKFWSEAVKYRARTAEALENAQAYYKEHPEKDTRGRDSINQLQERENEDVTVDFKPLGSLPLPEDFADIVAISKYGNQQFDAGRVLVNNLEILRSGFINRWLKTENFTNEEISAAQSWIGSVVEKTWADFQKQRSDSAEYEKNSEFYREQIRKLKSETDS